MSTERGKKVIYKRKGGKDNKPLCIRGFAVKQKEGTKKKKKTEDFFFIP